MRPSISQYNYGIEGNENYRVRKWDNGYKTIPGATLEGQQIGSEVVFKVSYQITDGDDLDSDSAENGVIIDPAGPALLVTQTNQSTNNTSTSSGSLADTGSSIAPLLYIGVALIGLGFVGLACKKFTE